MPDPPRGTAPGSIGAIVQNLKSTSARQINRRRRTPGAPVWQRNYSERVVRNEAELERHRQYIEQNPELWEQEMGSTADPAATWPMTT